MTDAPDPTTPATADTGTGADAPAWHALDGTETLARLATGPEGLTAEEAAARLAEHGPNRLPEPEPAGALTLLARQFRSPLILVLVAAAVATLALREYADSTVILTVLVLNALIGFSQERRADRSVQALMALTSPTAVVRRDGRAATVDAATLVPGDVVVLAAGDRVPADLRLLEASGLRADESLLTGESHTVAKSTDPVPAERLAADRRSILHLGTTVTTGRAVGAVVATGAGTVLGGIATDVGGQERPPTPLQRRMTRFANLIAVIVLATSVAVYGLGVAVGGDPTTLLLVAVALAVAVVPEDLPAVLTIVLSVGVRRMARRRVIVRTLPAVETLGSTTVIGSDKTGTLTENRMRATTVWTAAGERELEGADPGADAALDALLRTAVLTNDARLPDVGDPTELALLTAADDAGLPPDGVRDRADVLLDVPFRSEQQSSHVVVDDGGPLQHVKGAPERLIALADTVLTADGTTEPLDRAAASAVARRLAADGLRVLATAHVRRDDVPDADAGPPAGLTLTGLVGLQDPPRPGVADAIARCRRAGVRVLMITGDHPDTATAIARQLGIADTDAAAAITGDELARTDDATLARRVRDTDVFARVAPDHKLRIVRALQAQGAVVAVTGDGVNDAPALKAADLGIAMGRDGTDVAREAADMILVEDDFTAIVDAVEQGRVVFDNLRKATYFLLSTGAAAIVALTLATVTGLPNPYTPAALLWLNVVTNGLQDVALAFERGEPDVLDRPPRERRDGIVSGVLWERTALIGTTMALGSLWLFHWAGDVGLTPDARRGAALTTLVLGMAVHAYNARSVRRSIVASDPRTNRLLLGSVLGSVALHVAALHWAPTRTLLRVAPVEGAGWARMLLVAALVVLVSELHKRLRPVDGREGREGAPR